MLLGLNGLMSSTADIGHDHLLGVSDYVAYAVCHRLPGHSFEVFGRTLPLCARCSGIYLGIMLTFAMMILTGRHRSARFPRRPFLLTIIALLAIMAFDGLNSLAHDIGIFHLYEPHNTLRMITGFGAGIAVALIITVTFAQTAWRDYRREAPIETTGELFILLALAAALTLAILSNQTTILYVLSIVSAVGVLTILTTLYTTLTLIIMRRDGTIERARQLALPAMIGFLLTVAQIVATATLRFNVTGTWSGF